MARFGWLFLILGFGSLVLPTFNLQFSLLEPLDPYQPMAGIIVGVIGVVMLVWPMIRAQRGPSA